ncbi:MAG: hypothetical protein K2K84_07775, partial [Muribaculaceae bacterium]|nr:hypothetical protein [Muribaculaceae bacterium]
LYALLLDAAFLSRNPDMPECLSVPKIPVEKPVEKPQPEKVPATEEKSQPVVDRWEHPGYQRGMSPFGYDEGDDILIDDPDDYDPEECGPDDMVEDDGTLLLDSDEAEKKRREMRDNQRRMADLERARQEKEEAERVKADKPSILERFKYKVANFVGKNTAGDGEGADLDD